MTAAGALVTEPEQPGGQRPQSPMSYLSLGFELVAPVMLLTYGGYWLDSRLGTLPWFLIVGAFLGMAVGFYGLFRRVVLPSQDPKNGKKR